MKIEKDDIYKRFDMSIDTDYWFILPQVLIDIRSREIDLGFLCIWFCIKLYKNK